MRATPSQTALLRARPRRTETQPLRVAPAAPPQPTRRRPPRLLLGTGRRPPTTAARPRTRPPAPPCHNRRLRHAEDEDPLGREEALQSHRQGQGARPAPLHEPHPREEVAEAQ